METADVGCDGGLCQRSTSGGFKTLAMYIVLEKGSDFEITCLDQYGCEDRLDSNSCFDTELQTVRNSKKPLSWWQLLPSWWHSRSPWVQATRDTKPVELWNRSHSCGGTWCKEASSKNGRVGHCHYVAWWGWGEADRRHHYITPKPRWTWLWAFRIGTSGI